MTEAEFDGYLYSDLCFMLKMMAKEQKRETVNSAFMAWLLGAGQDKTFEQFLVYYGLAEKKKIDPDAMIKANRLISRLKNMTTKRARRKK